MVKQADYEKIFASLAAQTPSPQPELAYKSTFELLIAVILSAQATDISVNKATRVLYPIANTPETILALGETGLIPYIKRIGLYKSKAKHIIATCQQLIHNHQSIVPNTMASLEALPGVGRKTANVVLNMAFGQPTLAVDTHVFRVANRTGMAKSKTTNGVERILLKNIPKPYLMNAHHWLILHGRYVCKARRPECASCCIAQLCAWPEKTT